MTGAVAHHHALTDPLLSVVVTIIENGPAVRVVLEALAAQHDPPRMEVLVPYDDSIEGIEELRADFPSVHFLPMGPTAIDHRSHAEKHALIDQRRGVALAAARGDYVAIIEDRGPPRPTWARAATAVHEGPWAVVGGAVEPASHDLLGWALDVCDYSRYELPFTSGPRGWVSDVNAVYKRRAIESTRSIWTRRYQEPVLHSDLMRRGEQLYLSSELIVDHSRQPVPLATALAERFSGGRVFAGFRAKEMGWRQRAQRIAVGPLVPFVVLARHGVVQARRGEWARFIVAVPLFVGLIGAWTAGETWGYLTGKP